MKGIKGISTTFFGVAILLFLPGLVLGDSLVIDQNGNVGIGTSSPSEKLEVDGSLKISGGIEMPSNISIGSGVTIEGNNNVVIGKYADSTGFFGNGIAIGYNAHATDDTIAIGKYSSAGGNGNSITIGQDAESYYSGSITIGADASNTGVYSILIGADANLHHNYSVALGQNSTTTASNQFMVGNSSYNLDTYIYGDLTVNGDEANLGIKTTVFGANAEGVLGIANGTEPTSSPEDMVQLYAKDYIDGDGTSTSELFVRDEDGNATDLSPHIFALFKPDPDEPLPWSYYSENQYIGKRINVDMAGALRALEELTGKRFIYYEDIRRTDPEKGKLEAWKKKWIAENIKEVGIQKYEAFKYVEMEVDDTDSVIGEKIRYKLRGTEVIEVREPKYSTKTVQTPVLKEGIRFDGETGRFYLLKIPTEAEAESAAYSHFQMKIRGWVRDRM